MTKIALITGASGGLGQALAHELLTEGWRLAVVGRDGGRLRDCYGSKALCLEADVATPEGAQAAIAGCQERLGTPSALANCAGSVLITPLHRTSPAQYRACLAANLDTAFFSLSALVEALRQARQPGAAVLVSTVAARVGAPNHEAIAAAKAGVEGLIRAAAASYAASRIRVNGVAPGLLATPATARILGSEVGRDSAARQYPLGRVGDPVEVARLMAWLLSDKAAWITGQIWAVDGGFSAIRPLIK